MTCAVFRQLCSYLLAASVVYIVSGNLERGKGKTILLSLPGSSTSTAIGEALHNCHSLLVRWLHYIFSNMHPGICFLQECVDPVLM